MSTLPNQFNFEYGKLNCVIHYDNVSQREQDQIKLDIQNAYEAYKAKFCMDSDTQVTVHTYVFNNRYDYKGYGTLVPGFSWNQSSLNISGGMTNGESVLLYKNAYTDNVLAHEFGHVFQFKFSPTKVRELDYKNSQLMANAIGLEVEEKNYKAICKQIGVDEYEDHGWMFKFKYKGINYDIQHKGYLLVVKEKLQLIQDIKKNFHESLVSEYYRLNKEPLSQNTTVTMSMNKNKEPEEDMSRSKPEQDVDEVDNKSPKTEKGSEGTPR
ncbi:hypothetical protein [Wolbachia endosymbiont (group A) of Cheilosia soror]|uniref:hypothetical protein n=1 Tax=Wolbachia endosymbiont (group A) of Cheilosia soror TaxID=2953995 RepID=UPI0021F8BD77|nr:hypothetical protein [Wolbachia endosymbiont (group A) of Cheilosia soror]